VSLCCLTGVCCCCCCCFCASRWHLYDLLANRSAWWAPGKTLELRRRLKPYWQVGEPCRSNRLIRGGG
jgi:hypothetical protein